METDLPTIIIFTLPIFLSLEFIFVLIPALMKRSKINRNFQTPPEIPSVLYRPISAESKVLMRSWYIDRHDSRQYIKKPLEVYSAAIKGETGALVQKKALPPPPSPVREPVKIPKEPAKDWKAINRANWAIQRANEAIKEANRAIDQANEAIDLANVSELAWMDTISEIECLNIGIKK